MIGKFIVLEGINCCGKTTVIEEIKKRNIENLVFTSEPYEIKLPNPCGASWIGRILEQRRKHIEEVINPALSYGKTVICSRFTLSTLVYNNKTVRMCKSRQRIFDVENPLLVKPIYAVFCTDPTECASRLLAVRRRAQVPIIDGWDSIQFIEILRFARYRYYSEVRNLIDLSYEIVLLHDTLSPEVVDDAVDRVLELL